MTSRPGTCSSATRSGPVGKPSTRSRRWGPWIVTADEIPDPQDLGIRCLVNGEIRQDDTTAHMVFSVARIIEFITEAITLSPGDVIYTGTPPGVGHGRTPPAYLQAGDAVRVEIERIGAIENRIVRAR